VFPARFIPFGLVLAQLADATTFMVGVAVIVATTTLLAKRAPRLPRLLVWGGAAATGLGLLGFTANTTSILLLS